MEKFQHLKQFEITESDIKVIPSSIAWPVSVEAISLFLPNLEAIEPFAFSRASKLKKIDLHGSGYKQEKVIFKSNAFHTTSPVHKSLQISLAKIMNPSKNVVFESNCFGNVEGGKLWDVLEITTNGFGIEFTEEAFRLILKTHFDKGHKSKYF